jgi:antitoxin (DNA-binding transcriptional repressor) of toxin-antitoxin stability system
MSTVVTLEEAKIRLAELIEQLGPDDEDVITRNNQPLAPLLPSVESTPRPQFGSCKGMLTIISDDDEHLEHFKDYGR